MKDLESEAEVRTIQWIVLLANNTRLGQPVADTRERNAAWLAGDFLSES